MWEVSVKPNFKLEGIYGRKYFPRKYYYKKDATLLAADVKKQGGEATVKKVKKKRP